MLSRTRKAIAARFEALAEIAGLALSLSGAAIASLLGKLLLALILGAIALGIFFRLAGRQRRAQAAGAPRQPAWPGVVASLLALVEAGVVVEAVDLPVRFHQPGFAFHHWLIVAVAVLAATWLQRRLLRSARDAVSSRRRP